MINNINIDSLKEFNELGLLVNSNFLNIYKLEDILSNEYDYLYGYYLDDKLVAFIHVNKLYEVMDIVNVVVNPSYRKKGIATKLIDYAISQFDDLKSIMLEVNENNSNAISLYNKNSFKVINKRNNYYGSEAALIMKRDV